MENIKKEAYRIVLEVLRKKHRSEVLLEKAAAKLTNEKEKALLYHLVRGLLKMVLNLEYISGQLCDKSKFAKTDAKIKVLLYLGLYQLRYCDGIPDYHIINEIVEIAKGLYGKVVADYINAVLREYCRRKESTGSDGIKYPETFPEYLSVKYSYPQEIINEWLNLWTKEEVETLCIYFNQPPKLSIRINRMATDKDRIIKYFDKKNIYFEPSRLSSSILSTPQVNETLNDVSFEEGYFSVQDASAAMIVELLNPQNDDSVLDLFAGPGGKCTYISEIMENTGEVIAIDRYPQKVKKIKHALYRLQITNTLVVTEDAFKYAPRAAAYNKVILDVPCSGWGVMQKKAELRWQAHQDMKSLLKLQEQALTTGSLFVKPGGILLYSTCTLNPQENEKQVEKFLANNQNFKMIDAASTIPARYVKNGFLTTLPQRDGVDGAFAAKLQKKD